MSEKKKRDFDEVSEEKNGEWKHLVKHCLELYDNVKGSKYRDDKIREIKKSREIYEQKEQTSNDPYPGASNIQLPLTTISVDNLEPRFVAGLVGKKPYVNFVLEGDAKPDEQTEIVETWWNSELEHGVKIDQFARDQVHELMLEGTVYPVPRYELDEIVRKDFQFDQEGNIVLNENQEPVMEEKKELVFEGGKIDLVPFTDVFIPDDIDDWEKAPFIRKVYPTYAELMRDSQDKTGYINIGEWLCKEEGEKKLTDDQKSPGQDVVNIKVTGKEVIECLECSISYVYRDEDEEKEDVKNWTEERIVVQIALEKQIIIRLVKLRDLNFKNEHLVKRIRLFTEKGRSYGTSVYGKMKSIQDGASKTFNVVMNSAHIMMMPWFFFESKVGLKGDIELYPGKGIPVNSVEGLHFPKFNFNPNQFIDFIYIWTAMWERLLSIGDLQVGRPKDDKKTTATEVMAVIQEGNVKHNYQSEQFKEEFLSVIRTLYDLYYQYMPLNKTFLHKEEEVPIPRQVMGRQRKFRLTGSTEMMNKLIERKQNEDFYNMAMNDPKGVFNPVPIAEDLAKSYGKDDPEKYINPFMAWMSMVLQEMPQIEPVLREAVQDTIQAAQEIEGTDVAQGDDIQ